MPLLPRFDAAHVCRQTTEFEAHAAREMRSANGPLAGYSVLGVKTGENLAAPLLTAGPTKRDGTVGGLACAEPSPLRASIRLIGTAEKNILSCIRGAPRPIDSNYRPCRTVLARLTLTTWVKSETRLWQLSPLLYHRGMIDKFRYDLIAAGRIGRRA